MTEKTYEIRVCDSCGLRFPVVHGQHRGVRCPVCMGTTHAVHTLKMSFEPAFTPTPPGNRQYSVLLDNIRSAWNVGSILRSADGFGFSHAYLCGITPSPEHTAVRKTSLGAEDTVTWSQHRDAVKLIKGLKNEGRIVITLEDSPRATAINQRAQFTSARPVVLILGSEVTGVDPDLLELSDEIVHIPMLGGKKSLNVAVAFSVAAFALQK